MSESSVALRAVVAEDAPLLRRAIALVLESGGIEVVAQTGDGPALLAAARARIPDVAVIDIRMPPSHQREGLEAALEIRRDYPGVGIVLLSQHVDPHVAEQLFAEQVPRGLGYLLKERSAAVEAFIEGVRTVAAGGCVLDPEIVAVLMSRRARIDPLATLTPRERQVLALMAQGLSNAAIGRQLRMGDRTVETHVRRIFTQFGLLPSDEVNRRVQAVLAYLRAQSG